MALSTRQRANTPKQGSHARSGSPICAKALKTSSAFNNFVPSLNATPFLWEEQATKLQLKAFRGRKEQVGTRSDYVTKAVYSILHNKSLKTSWRKYTGANKEYILTT